MLTLDGSPPGTISSGRDGDGPAAWAARPQPLLTPEGVVVELTVAGVGSRLAAACIDVLVVYGGISVALTVVSLLAGVIGFSTLAAIGFAILGGVGVLAYPAVLESLWQGRTLGKAALGIRVVTVTGGPVRPRQAMLRAVLTLVDLFLVPPAVLWVTALLVTRRTRRLGDLVAGTMVIRERVATVPPLRPLAFAPPADHARLPALVDAGRLTTRQYRLIRSFLVRAPHLRRAARVQAGRRLADAVAPLVGAPPGSAAQPEPFLASVAAAYQARHRRNGTGGLPTGR